ncbi:uncharacterized protein LOC144445866 [Glandiceps talaboti]
MYSYTGENQYDTCNCQHVNNFDVQELLAVVKVALQNGEKISVVELVTLFPMVVQLSVILTESIHAVRHLVGVVIQFIIANALPVLIMGDKKQLLRGIWNRMSCCEGGVCRFVTNTELVGWWQISNT